MASQDGTQSKSQSIANWLNEVSNYLLELCMSLHKKGKSGDNGFKKDLWQSIANEVNEKFGYSYDMEQCRTHFKNWKARFRALSDLQKLSGMGWNSDESKFEAPQSVWKKLKKEKKFWKDHKVTPLYLEVATWLCKEMASGNGSSHPFDSSRHVPVNSSIPDSSFENINIAYEDDVVVGLGNQSSSTTSRVNRSRGRPSSSIDGGSAKKKKGTAEKLGSPLKVIANAVLQLTNKESDLARRINHEMDAIQGIEFQERMSLKEFFVYNKEKTNLFFTANETANEEAKPDMIAYYLDVYKRSNNTTYDNNDTFDSV